MVECEDGYNMLGHSSQYSCGLNGTEVVWTFTGNGVTCCPGTTITYVSLYPVIIIPKHKLRTYVPL